MTKPNDAIAIVVSVLILGGFIAFYVFTYRCRADADSEDDDDDEYNDAYGAVGSSAFLSTSAGEPGDGVRRPPPVVLAQSGRSRCPPANPSSPMGTGAVPDSPRQDSGTGASGAGSHGNSIRIAEETGGTPPPHAVDVEHSDDRG